MREYLPRGSVTGDLHPPPPFPPKIFLRGVEVPNFDPLFPKIWSSDLHGISHIGGGYHAAKGAVYVIGEKIFFTPGGDVKYW